MQTRQMERGWWWSQFLRGNQKELMEQKLLSQQCPHRDQAGEERLTSKYPSLPGLSWGLDSNKQTQFQLGPQLVDRSWRGSHTHTHTHSALCFFSSRRRQYTEWCQDPFQLWKTSHNHSSWMPDSLAQAPLSQTPKGGLLTVAPIFPQQAWETLHSASGYIAWSLSLTFLICKMVSYL